MLPSVGWKYSPSLDAEGCPSSCSSLCLFLRQLQRYLLHFTGNRQEFAETGAAKEEKEMRLVKAMVFKSREVVKGKT